MSDLSQLLTFAQTPDKSDLFFGPDPIWTPAREETGVIRNKIKVIPQDCAECRNKADLPALDTLDVLCARCMQSHHKNNRGRGHDAQPNRLGVLAARVKGKPDPSLNAYLRKGAVEMSGDAAKSTEADIEDRDGRTEFAVTGLSPDGLAGGTQPLGGRVQTRREKREAKFVGTVVGRVAKMKSDARSDARSDAKSAAKAAVVDAVLAGTSPQ